MTVRTMITAKNRTTMLVDIGKAKGMPIRNINPPKILPPRRAINPPSMTMANREAIKMDAILFIK